MEKTRWRFRRLHHQPAGNRMAVTCPDPTVAKLVPLFVRRRYHPLEVCHFKLMPLRRLGPKRGDQVLGGRPSLIVQLDFVEPRFVAKRVGNGAAEPWIIHG